MWLPTSVGGVSGPTPMTLLALRIGFRGFGFDVIELQTSLLDRLPEPTVLTLDVNGPVVGRVSIYGDFNGVILVYDEPQSMDDAPCAVSDVGLEDHFTGVHGSPKDVSLTCRRVDLG
jgi:hypothetical protein